MAIKILVVEDEVLIAEDIAADLEDMEFDVVGTAISSKECFEMFEKYQPDLVMMDIKIKGELNGIEVVKVLKKKAPIPIVYLSSNTDSATLQKVVESQPQAFLSKPYNKKELKTAVELAFLNHNKQELLDTNAKKPLQTSVFVKSGSFYRKIELKDILYIEAAGSYSTVFTSSGEYILSTNLQTFQNKIALPDFTRIHRSY
ncbi:MAG: DNA-binding LytR/AlgR family response regulator, partial [Vicingaceae bacterium]